MRRTLSFTPYRFSRTQIRSFAETGDLLLQVECLGAAVTTLSTIGMTIVKGR